MIFNTTPSLNAILTGLKLQIFEKLNCVGIGRVMSMNLENGTVSLKMITKPKLTTVAKALNDNYIDDEKSKGHSTPVYKDVPILMSFATRPLYYNDNVVVIFNDYDFSSWYENDDYIEKGTVLHDKSYAIAIAGIDNLKNTIMMTPAGYKEPNVSGLAKAPFPKYGYDNENACFRYANGDIRAGVWGVNIISRDCTDINMFAENGSINMFPTKGFSVNTGICRMQVMADPTAGNLEGIELSDTAMKQANRLTMYTTVNSKIITADTEEERQELAEEGLEEGDKVYTSDMYRIMRYIRASLKAISNFIGSDDFAGKLISAGTTMQNADDIHVKDAGGDILTAGLSAKKFSEDFMQNIMELGTRIDGMLAPAEPVKEEGEQTE